MKVVYVSPDPVAFLTAPTKEDIDRDRCAKCYWKNPETCRICKQKEEK